MTCLNLCTLIIASDALNKLIVLIDATLSLTLKLFDTVLELRPFKISVKPVYQAIHPCIVQFQYIK